MWKLLAAITIGSCTVWIHPVSAVEFTVDRVVFENGHRLRATLFCRADMWRIEHNATGPDNRPKRQGDHMAVVTADKTLRHLAV